MSLPMDLHSVAATAAERLLFSLATGTMLALAVGLLLRLLPRRDSRASFAVWFATLVITAVLPLAGFVSGRGAAAEQTTRAVVTISSSWAVAMFLAWAVVALIGLARVALALWQVRCLKSGAAALDGGKLSPEIEVLLRDFQRTRRVELLVSSRLDVPTAVGFFSPAVVLPEWLLQGSPAEELKYIILHELAHLRRRDDWSNLAQQVVKAILFFLPSVWWIERRLALDREMACDDAVLAHSGTPQGYAECLTRVAERSFLRRQLALAQAAVARLRQLTVRVAKILDPNRQQPSHLWKPAIPAVMVTAGLCVFSGSQAPQLIGFSDGGPMAVSQTAQKPADAQMPGSVSAANTKPAESARLVAANLGISGGESTAMKVRAWDAVLKSNEGRAKAAVNSKVARPGSGSARNPAPKTDSNREATVLAKSQVPRQAAEYVTVREEYFMFVRQGPQSAVQESWQVHFVEISVVPAKPPQKQDPKKI
jgi:bla regulator protein blaR1